MGREEVGRGEMRIMVWVHCGLVSTQSDYYSLGGDAHYGVGALRRGRGAVWVRVIVWCIVAWARCSVGGCYCMAHHGVGARYCMAHHGVGA